MQSKAKGKRNKAITPVNKVGVRIWNLNCVREMKKDFENIVILH